MKNEILDKNYTLSVYMDLAGYSDSCAKNKSNWEDVDTLSQEDEKLNSWIYEFQQNAVKFYDRHNFSTKPDIQGDGIFSVKNSDSPAIMDVDSWNRFIRHLANFVTDNKNNPLNFLNQGLRVSVCCGVEMKTKFEYQWKGETVVKEIWSGGKINNSNTYLKKPFVKKHRNVIVCDEETTDLLISWDLITKLEQLLSKDFDIFVEEDCLVIALKENASHKVEIISEKVNMVVVYFYIPTYVATCTALKQLWTTKQTETTVEDKKFSDFITKFHTNCFNFFETNNFHTTPEVQGSGTFAVKFFTDETEKESFLVDVVDQCETFVQNFLRIESPIKDIRQQIRIGVASGVDLRTVFKNSFKDDFTTSDIWTGGEVNNVCNLLKKTLKTEKRNFIAIDGITAQILLDHQDKLTNNEWTLEKDKDGNYILFVNNSHSKEGK